MKLFEVHKDVERYLEEDCYCPNEVYSVDGFGYLLVFGDADCKVINTYDNPNGDEKVTFVVTASGTKHDHPILLNIWHDNDKIYNMERYEYSEENIKNIDAYFKGEIKSVNLTEAEDLKKSVEEILSIADGVLI